MSPAETGEPTRDPPRDATTRDGLLLTLAVSSGFAFGVVVSWAWSALTGMIGP